MENLHIIGMEIKNFMKISHVQLKLDGGSLVVAGKNGQGKSSLIKAIWAALEGRNGKIDEPINRDGDGNASVTIDLGDLIVTKTWSDASGAAGYLKVSTKEGATYSKAQGMLDDLFCMVSIDPHRFMALTDKEMVETLTQIAPIGIDLVEHAAFRKTIFDDRTNINREVGRLKGVIDSAEKPDDDVPSELVVISELLAEQRRLSDIASKQGEKKLRVDTLRDNAERIKRDIDSGKESIAACADKLQKDLDESLVRYNAELDRLLDAKEKAVETLQSNIDGFAIEYDSTVQQGTALKEEVDNFVAPDLDGIREKIEQAETTNNSIRLATAYRDNVSLHESEVEKSKAKTVELDGMDKKKTDAIKAANIPVDSIGIGDGFLTYNGTPFKQASHAQQMVAALQLLMSQDPAIKLITLTDASLMDEDSWADVRKMADVGGFQIISEFICNKPEHLEMIISDGDQGVFMDDGSIS